VARHLMRSFNEEVIRCLIALPSVQATDDETAIKNTGARARWVLARFTACNLGAPQLDSLIDSSDSEIRIVFASVLGKLGVRNDHIVDALTRLSKDQDRRVRKTAEESLARVQMNPVWLGYPGTS